MLYECEDVAEVLAVKWDVGGSVGGGYTAGMTRKDPRKFGGAKHVSFMLPLCNKDAYFSKPWPNRFLRCRLQAIWSGLPGVVWLVQVRYVFLKVFDVFT